MEFSSSTTASNGAASSIAAAGSNSISAGILLNSNLSVSNSGTLTLTGSVGGSGKTVTVSGSGLLILATSCGYTGRTTINGGTLQIGAGGSGEGIASSSIANNSYLVFSHSDALTLAAPSPAPANCSSTEAVDWY